MKIKTIILFSALAAVTAGLVVLASWLLSSSLASLDVNMPYLAAPRITDSNTLATLGDNSGIAWCYGTIVSSESGLMLQAPLSKMNCLYYYDEKRLGTEETDSDGDSYMVWTVVESDLEFVEVALQLSGDKKVLITGNIVYYNLEPVADIYKTDDQTDYNYREYIVPIENKVWVIGKLENGVIGNTELGIFASFSSPESIIHHFRDESMLLLFFSILSFIAAAGFLFSAVIVLLKAKKPDMQWIPIVMAIFSLFFFWVLTGILLVCLSEQKVLEMILSGLLMGGMACGFGIPILATVACRRRIVFSLLFFPAAIGFVVFGAWLLYRTLFMLEDSTLFPIGYFLCIAAAFALVQLYRMKFARE